MPSEDEKPEGLEPSVQTADVTEDTSAPAEVETGAADPSSAPGAQPEDMLSVVRDVVSTAEEPASPAKEDPEPEPEGEADPEPERDDADYSDVPFNKHPRFQQLLRKAKDNEADAVRYRNVDTFLKQNSLDAEEAADGLRIMALAKSDPAKALAELKPWVQRLLVASGEVLPDDLKARVQSGEMPAAAAQEVSRSRAQLDIQRQAQELAEQRRQQEAAAAQTNALRDTALSWASDRDAKDPAFQQKYPLLQREIAFLQRTEGLPASPEGVRDQLNRAYAEVNKQARTVAQPARPARQPIRPVVGGAAPGTHNPEPKSMVEAIRAARGA